MKSLARTDERKHLVWGKGDFRVEKRPALHGPVETPELVQRNKEIGRREFERDGLGAARLQVVGLVNNDDRVGQIEVLRFPCDGVDDIVVWGKDNLGLCQHVARDVVRAGSIVRDIREIKKKKKGVCTYWYCRPNCTISSMSATFSLKSGWALKKSARVFSRGLLERRAYCRRAGETRTSVGPPFAGMPASFARSSRAMPPRILCTSGRASRGCTCAA